MPLITPPFRTSLLTANGAPFATDNGDIQTTRDWWLYWNQLTDRSNSNSKLASEGSHADRPDAGSMPDGAIYIEADRGAIYSNEGGTWQYIAGTMYGTLSPDERPTDLGTHDAGFDFRGTDQPREFLWSQTAWVEVTAVRYGTHAARLATATTDIWQGALWVETDRGNVIYENQGGTWKYVAGAMAGTVIATDQRPTGLGANDVGFLFLSTDSTSVRWNGGSWDALDRILDLGPTPVASQLVAKANGAGALSLLAFNADNINLGFDVDWSGTAWVARAATCAWMMKIAGLLKLVRSSGNTLGGTAAQTDAVMLDLATGNVGIGGTPAGKLQVVTANDTTPSSMPAWDTRHLVVGQSGNTGGVGISYNNTGGYGVIQAISPGAAWRSLVLQSGGGGVGIGMGAAPGFQLQLSTDSGAKPGTSTWTVVSDLKLKRNIEPVKDDSLAILGKLDWIRYEYNGQAKTPEGLQAIGLVAQELQRQLPEAVRSTRTKLKETDADETDVLAIDYHHILVHSARAIQQLSAEVESLKAMFVKPQSSPE